MGRSSVHVDPQILQRVPGTTRLPRAELFAAAILAMIAAAWIGPQLLGLAGAWDRVAPGVGLDFVIYRDAAARWLAGGSFYLPEQLAGPYPVAPPQVLYPPPSLLIFVPFTILPASLWWVIPIGITVWAIAAHRPRPVAIGVILLCLADPTTLPILVHGNPVIWLVAAIALATHRAWPAVLVFLKPTLLPFALFGAWHRSWWVALAGAGLLSLLFLPMWDDYVTVAMNARLPGGLGYSIAQIPMLLIPIAAWVGRQQRSAHIATRSPLRRPWLTRAE
jgi:hypothetical protein